MAKEPAEMLLRSKHLCYFQQHGEIFAFHNLFGYLLSMSADLVDLLEFHHSDLRTREEVDAEFGEHFDKEQLDEFMTVFRLFSCLIDSELGEERSLWSMVPVRVRWVVFHQPSERQLTFWRTDRAGASSADPVAPWAARLWSMTNGERKLRDLYDDVKDDPSLAEFSNPEQHVLDTLAEWVHHERQYLKFAKAPLSKYGKEHQWPSYLRSTMPFAPWRPGVDPVPTNALEPVGVPLAPPHGYYESGVADPEKQFHEVETTLSHLLREPHVLLGGKSYSDRVVEALVKRGHLGAETHDVLEIGAGVGHFAAGFLARVREDHPEVFAGLRYTILDLSPALRGAQKALLEARGLADKVRWREANAETADLGEDAVDLLLCNEVIGDFTTVKLTREIVGLTEELDPAKAFETWTEETIKKLGDTGDVLREYAIPLRDAPDSFYFNVGAIQFLPRLLRALRPGGSAFVTEYGDALKYPVAGTHLDHLEFSIHFGHLVHVARRLGLDVDFQYVQDVIGLDRNAMTLTTARTYFTSLRAMLASFGVLLDKIAYTREMFEALVEDAVPIGEIGDVRFQIVDERCMGLAPHEFKALFLKKPVTAG